MINKIKFWILKYATRKSIGTMFRLLGWSIHNINMKTRTVLIKKGDFSVLWYSKPNTWVLYQKQYNGSVNVLKNPDTQDLIDFLKNPGVKMHFITKF